MAPDIAWDGHYLIILPVLCALSMWRWFSETKLLALQEIATLFGDEAAVDISHLNGGIQAILRQRIRRELGE